MFLSMNYTKLLHFHQQKIPSVCDAHFSESKQTDHLLYSQQVICPFWYYLLFNMKEVSLRL